MPRLPLVAAVAALLCAGAALPRPAQAAPAGTSHGADPGARRAAAQPTRDDARRMADAAVRAVEGDSVAAVRARWERRLRDDAGDRLAMHGLATLARLTYDYPGAERLYARIDEGRATRDALSVQATIGQAMVALTRGHFAPAAALVDRVIADARTIGDRVGEAEGLLLLATIHSRNAGPAAARATLERARAAIPATGHDDLLAVYHCQRAALGYQSGADDSEADAARGMAAARRAGSRRLEASCLFARGAALASLSSMSQAIDLLAVADSLQRLTRDRSARARTLQWRGYMFSRLGLLDSAEVHLRAALRESEVSGNGSAAAWSLLNLAHLARYVGDRAVASERLDRAARLFEVQGDTWGAMSLRGDQADLAAERGDLATAERLLRERLEWARRTQNARERYLTWSTMVHVAVYAGDTARAIVATDSAVAAAQSSGLLEPGHHPLPVTAGWIALTRGDLATAERQLRAGLDGYAPSQTLLRYPVHVWLALVQSRAGRAAQAAATMRAANDELDGWRATLSDRELRLRAFQAASEEEFGAFAAPVASVVAELVKAGEVAAAYEVADRHRSRELLDRLLALGSASADSARRTPGPLGARSGAAASLVVPDARTAVLEYVTSDQGPTTVFVVHAGGTSARVLATDSLAARVTRFVSLLESGSDGAAAGRALGEALLAPALAMLPPAVDRLVVIPDGPLHRLPFDVLRLGDGRYALERYAIGTAPSGAVLAQLWRRPATTRRPVRLLAFGDPDFTYGGDAAELVRAAQAPTRGADEGAALPPLPASGTEARLAARYAPLSQVRLGDEASESFLKGAPLDSFTVLHFATHALVHETALARSALALAPGQGEDGLLSATELGALRLDAALVVLSACRTAGGVMLSGEGVQGFTASMLAAGARSVLATDWPVGDESTVPLIRDFYGALADGSTAAEALRTAKLAAIRRGDPPSEWAAFRLVGDPLTTVPLRQPPRRSVPLTWLAAALLLTAGGLWWWRMHGSTAEGTAEEGTADGGTADFRG